jgi:hypothetical protein
MKRRSNWMFIFIMHEAPYLHINIKMWLTLYTLNTGFYYKPSHRVKVTRLRLKIRAIQLCLIDYAADICFLYILTVSFSFTIVYSVSFLILSFSTTSQGATGYVVCINPWMVFNVSANTYTIFLRKLAMKITDWLSQKLILFTQ